MKTRTDLLNHLAERYNLQRYLEIGVQNTAQNFDRIKCKQKIGVDPNIEVFRGDILLVTSDRFFENPYGQPFDLIFIDGLHTAEQVKKDFENALKVLSPNGFIVLHDCNPEKEEHTIVPRPKPTGHWNGDVYKFASSVFCKKVTIDIDNGCIIIPQQDGIVYSNTYPSWKTFENFRKEMLNLISWDEFISIGAYV